MDEDNIAIFARRTGFNSHAGRRQRIGRRAVPGAKASCTIADQRCFEFDSNHRLLRAIDCANDQLTTGKIKYQLGADRDTHQARPSESRRWYSILGP